MSNNARSESRGSVAIRRVRPGEERGYRELERIGDQYLKQLISFHDISQLIEMPPDTDRGFGAWFKQAVAMLNEDEKKELRETTASMARSLGAVAKLEVQESGSDKAIAKKNVSNEDDEASVSIKSPEVLAIIMALFQREIPRVGASDKSELIAQ